MCTEVSSPHPPPMYASKLTESGSLAIEDARLEVHLLRPAAEQTLVGRIGDAVDAPRRAARRRAMHRAGQTSPARPVHVEEGDAIAFARAARRRHRSAGPRTASSVPVVTCPGMIGYGTPDRRPCQRCTSVPQTSEQRGPHQRAARREIGLGKLPNFDGHLRCRHHGGKDRSESWRTIGAAGCRALRSLSSCLLATIADAVRGARARRDDRGRARRRVSRRDRRARRSTNAFIRVDADAAHEPMRASRSRASARG